jgi:hypothetical protein
MKSKKNVKKYRKKSTRNYGKKSQKKGGTNHPLAIKVKYASHVDLTDQSEEVYFKFQYNICAIYSNPIFFIKTTDCDNEYNKVPINHPVQLRTPCQEMKNITLNSNNKHFIVPAVTKENIMYILKDEMNFDTEILFITSHSHDNKILCEDINGKCYLKRDKDNHLYICNSNQLMSCEEFCSNLLVKNSIKLLFFNCCSMLPFALEVSREFPKLYIICWSTDAEDVSCLEFQKKILDELNKLQGDDLKDDNLKIVYKNAAISFINSCGNIERIKDPSEFSKNELMTLRPTGLNCLIKNEVLIDKLENLVYEYGVHEDVEVPELL